jgi:hypothetical protein
MKHRIFGAAIVALLSIAAAACTTWTPGEMQGGTETGTVSGPGDSIHSLGSDKADGMGKPVAGGLQNVDPRQIYTHADSNLTNHPY